MKVLLLNGSPRAHGCTYTALSEVAKTLTENGVEAEILQIGAGPVRGCIGCGKCAGKNRCIFGDDIVNTLIEKMESCDGFIVGSPVYYASANGAVECILDRAFYAGKNSFVHKPAAAVASARRAGTTATLDELLKYFTISQMPVVSSTYWPMVHGSKPEDVAKDEEGLQVMRNLGRNMAWLLKCIEAGKQAGVEVPQAESQFRTNFIQA